MKLPRDISGDRLVRALKRLGYILIRQQGSHVRLLHPGPPAHRVTIPLHSPLKVGTLGVILSGVAAAQSVSIEAVLELA